MDLYDWQKKLIETEGNTTTRGGRQTGKSVAEAHRIKYWCEKTPNGISLLTSPSERQENYLYQKVKELCGDRYRFKRRPTLKLMIFPNGHKLWKFPIGRTGIYVEGLSSVDYLYVDEAMHMSERPWDSILPMLAEPRSRGKGWINLLSNTRGKPFGFFYESFKRNDFTKFHISAEDTPHVTKEFLAAEKERLGESLYRSIWCGEFVETDYRFFKEDHIIRAMRLKSWTFNENYHQNKKYFIGIDPARFGKDKAAIAVAELNDDKINIIHKELIKKCSLVQLRDKVRDLNAHFNFNKFFIDGMGLGAGFVDMLVELYGSRVRELNNSSKGEFGKILKEDLYANVQRLLELDRLQIINDPEIFRSLNSVEYDGLEFQGEETDLAEAIIRVCWGIKEKSYEPKII